MLFKRPTLFPKQLFFRFVLQQILGVVPVLLLVALAARAYLGQRLSGLHTVDEAVAAYDNAFLFLALVMALTVSGITLWTGYRLVLPLGRILVKARSILRRDHGAHREEEEQDIEEPSEWSDLESTLHKIDRDLQSKDRSLSREREELEAIMSALSEAVVAIDKSGNLLFFNSQFVVLFGRHQRQNARLSDFIRDGEVLEAFRATIRDGVPRQAALAFQVKGEVTTRYFSLSLAPLRLENEYLYGAVGVFHDVSELRRADQVRIDFVANVSHELRTPLTSIKGYAQTLREDAPAETPQRRFLETIERNTDRLIALVQDLLNLSSLESGAELEREEIDLRELTGRVLAQVESLRSAKSQEIETSFDATKLLADPKRVEQVVYNLVENSIKYVPAGGNIRVAWLRDGGEITLQVRDDGPGIPVEHHTRVFERFYRVDAGRAREQGGTGLGLAIVKHIMQRHGGRVRLQGGPGLGSEFLCSFPLERQA